MNHLPECKPRHGISFAGPTVPTVAGGGGPLLPGGLNSHGGRENTGHFWKNMPGASRVPKESLFLRATRPGGMEGEGEIASAVRAWSPAFYRKVILGNFTHRPRPPCASGLLLVGKTHRHWRGGEIHQLLPG